VARIRAASPQTRVVGLAAHDSVSAYLEMLRAGMSGRLLVDCSADELTLLVRRVATRPD